MKLVTLKTFDNSIEAHLLKVKLESEGIRCFIFDENIVSMNPILTLQLEESNSIFQMPIKTKHSVFWRN